MINSYIVVEGTDCSGKSTIKKELEKATNFEVLCIDRLMPSSIVYNKIFKRNKLQEHSLITEFEFMIEELDYKFAYIQTDVSVLKSRLKERGDWLVKQENLIHLKSEYDKFFNKYKKIYPHNIIILKNNDKKQLQDNVDYLKNLVLKGRK